MKQLKIERDVNISIRNITKAFNKKTILKNFSVELLSGETILLLGLNGSGKSTLIKCIMDLLELEEGEIVISDLKYNSNSTTIKGFLGLSAEYNPLIEEFTALEYLQFIGAAYHISKSELDHRIKSILVYFFEDSNLESKLISDYSSGMKKKLSICAAFLNRPTILILDEPFTAIDFAAAKKLVNLIRQYQDSKRIIIIVSHELDNISELVTHVVVINNRIMNVKSSVEEFTKFRKMSIYDAFSELLHINNDEKDSSVSWI